MCIPCDFRIRNGVLLETALAARTRWDTDTNIHPWAMASARSCSGRGAQAAWPSTPAPRSRVYQRRMRDPGVGGWLRNDHQALTACCCLQLCKRGSIPALAEQTHRCRRRSTTGQAPVSPPPLMDLETGGPIQQQSWQPPARPPAVQLH